MTHRSLDLHRTLNAAPEEVWRRWTTAEGLRTWWWNHWQDTVVEADCRVGGHWSVTAPAAGIAVGGTYLEVEEPRRLVFSWVWTDEEGDGPVERVEVTFTPTDGGTRLDLVHSGPWPDHSQAEAYRQGWDEALDELAKG